MPRAFVKRNQADPHVVTAGQTLTAILGHCDPTFNITWQELALFNWATIDPLEVNRAIIEQLGCLEAEIDWVNPQNTIIRPTVPNPVIRLPKLYEQIMLSLNHTYTVKVKDALPAPAIRIESLDKWFRPGTENCDIRFSVEGVTARARLVDLDIHASNYCKASVKEDEGIVTFTYKPLDIRMRHITLGPQGERAQGNNVIWDGRTDVEEGVLAKASAAAPGRFINVAQSPYTMMLRYFKNTADGDAKLELFPFWPEFRSNTEASPKSLLIRWKVTGTSKLKFGQILIYDTAPGNPNRLIVRKPLRPDDLTEGEHSLQWDGERDDGHDIRRNRAPYRVQIQAHSGIDEDDGLAFAAMHTEVRLFTHQDIGTNADPVTDTQCLEFALAPHWPGPALQAGSTKWIKEKLADLGYHPGPVNSSKGRDEYKQAVREFQRSHAVEAVPPYTRLAMDGQAGSKTQASLTRAINNALLTGRPLFGDPANRNDVLPAAASTTLNDKAGNLIVWIDDRHAYTELQHKPPASLQQMDDYRGKMDISDERVTKDKESIPRPWIPVCASPAVLSKLDVLYPNAARPTLAAAPTMAELIGPIRIDWTFGEMSAADILTDVFVGPTAAEKQRTRTKAYLQYVTGERGAGVADGPKTYINCPEYLDATPAAAAADNGDPAIETEINRLVFAVNGVNVVVNFPKQRSITLAQAVAAINGAMGANPATAVVDDDQLEIHTNANGVGQTVTLVPALSSKALVKQLDFTDTAGKAGTPGTLISGYLRKFTTADQTRLRFRVDGKLVTVTTATGPNVAQANIVNDINNAIQNAGLNARARLDDANRIVVETNGFGTNRFIDVRQSSNALLLTRIGLATGEVRGTGTSAASTQTNGAATIDTAPLNLLVLRVNGARVDVQLTKDPELQKKRAAADITAACKTKGVKAYAEYDKATEFITIRTEEEDANQTLRISTDSHPELLTRLGLAAGTHTGAVSTPASVTSTAAGATVDTEDPARLHLHVDSKSITVNLPALPALSKAQAAVWIHSALQEAGAAAKATEAGGVITIETTGSGTKRTVKVRRTSSKILLENLGLTTGVKKSSGGQTFCGGIRPKDLGVYYRAPFGYEDKNSLAPWLAVDDEGKKVIATITHDNVGEQDPEKYFPGSRGRAGIYFRPSRIAGDGYRIGAAVSFEPMPDGSEHPNWAVLRSRYPKLPTGHTAQLQTWRKTSFRGYVGWTNAPAPAPGPAGTAAADYYRDAHVHFVHERSGAMNQFAVPTPGAVAPPNAVMTAADFAAVVSKRLDVKKGGYHHVTPQLAPGYVWPYLHQQHYGIPWKRLTLDDYQEWLGELENWTWDLVNEELLQRMIYNIERQEAKMRGHLIVEFTSTPDLELREYVCDTCSFVRSYVVNTRFAGGVDPGGVTGPTINGVVLPTNIAATPNCPTGCGGNLDIDEDTYADGLPISGIGLGMGATWLYQPRRVETWAHEMGHHRHLEHAQAQAGTSPDGAPGYQIEQHDAAGNPNYAGLGEWHQRSWDRHCIMSYDKSQPRRFCGKCSLRQRGWSVVYLNNAPAGTADP